MIAWAGTQCSDSGCDWFPAVIDINKNLVV